MITTTNLISTTGVTITVKYPTGTIFMRERNYLTISCAADDYYLKKIVLAGKTINFGRYYLFDGPMELDITPYYAKLYSLVNISLVVENQNEVDETFTVSFNITKIDGYSPFLEFVPERCVDATYARIVPPYRMLWDGKKNTTSMLAAVRDDDYFSGYEYEMEGVPYETYRPSDAWLTTAQKNEHLGETYRNTLPSTGNLSKLDSNGNPLWIEQGGLSIGSSHIGKTFEEQRVSSNNYCRTKTIFVYYKGMVIEGVPDNIEFVILLYDKNKNCTANTADISGGFTMPWDDFGFISFYFKKKDGSAITPSELAGITSSALTNPDAGKSYRWAHYLGKFQWVELTKEQIINNKFYWSVNSKNYSGDIVNNAFTFDKVFDARLIRAHNISPIFNEYFTVQSVKRGVSLADGSMPYVYIRWKTPWGVTVEHLFYLGSYTSDKAGAKELESVNYYEELSNHVRVGSFYLDGIVQPYDLFYYKTLENAELVEMYFPSYAFKPSTYMPNGDDYVAIKIKGSDVAEAVVDGVTKKTITFKFELS